MGLLRLLTAAVIGACVASIVPQVGLIASTQEIIAFLALLMAGLLPAMILTATILRGAGLSAKSVEEYGGALRLQLRFWAVLFAAASIASIGVVGIKIFSAQGAIVTITLHGWTIDQKTLTDVCVAIMGAGIGAVMQRMLPAYRGLVSLLSLNVRLAKTEAVMHDRSLESLIEQAADQEGQPEPYKLFSS